MINKLTKLATHLDLKGLKKEADYLDRIIKIIAEEGDGHQHLVGPCTAPTSYYTGAPKATHAGELFAGSCNGDHKWSGGQWVKMDCQLAEGLECVTSEYPNQRQHVDEAQLSQYGATPCVKCGP